MTNFVTPVIDSYDNFKDYQAQTSRDNTVTY
jgi:hypothetical protein